MMVKVNLKKLTVIFLLILSFIIPRIISDPYIMGILIICLVNSILAMSLGIIVRTGLLSFGHAAFVAIGSYTSALLVMKLHWSFWLALPAAGIMAAIVAMAIGYIILRVSGIGFVLLTFAFGEMIKLILIYWTDLTNGVTGIVSIPPPSLPGIGFFARQDYYYLILFLVIITAVVMHRLDISRPGRAMRAIAQSEALAQSIGIGIISYKLLSFTIAGFFAGISGSFMAHYLSVVAPEMYTFSISLYALTYVVVGGMGSAVSGPITGAFILSAASEIIRGLRTFAPIIYAIVIILIIFFLPGGIVTLPEQLSDLLRRLLPFGKKTVEHTSSSDIEVPSAEISMIEEDKTIDTIRS